LYYLPKQIEVLAAVVSSIAKEVESSTILDVGAGQVLNLFCFYVAAIVL
jgi:hypothetical protein